MIFIRFVAVFLAVSAITFQTHRADAGIADLRCYMNCAEDNREFYGAIAALPSMPHIQYESDYEYADHIFRLCESNCEYVRF